MSIATPLTNDDILNRVTILQKEATEIYLGDESGAEDYEKAELMIADAEFLVDKHQRLNELRNYAVDATEDGMTPEGQQRLALAQTVTDKIWPSFGEFLKAVNATKSGHFDNRLLYYEGEQVYSAKDMGGNIGGTGGYLAPTTFIPQIRALQAEASIVQGRATVLPMDRRTLEFPALDQTQTTANQTHYFGGILTYYEGESKAITSSQPAFRLVRLTAYDLTAAVFVPDSLLADSAVSLSAWLSGPLGLPGAFAHRADYGYLTGTGDGQPQGVIDAAATLAQTRTTASTIKYTDLVNMMGKALPSQNLVWIAHTTARPTLMLMEGPSGNPAYLWSSAVDGQPDRLLGYPIIFSEKVPVLGAKADIGLYNFQEYLIGDRETLLFSTSNEFRWLQNQTGFKAVMRHDGQPWLSAPFTLMDGTSKISPFVVLAA